MPLSSWSDPRSALAVGLALLAAGCRNDAAATDGSSAPSAARPSESPVATSSSAAPLASAPPPADGACAGPSQGPLPNLEERKLAKEQQGRYRFELKYPVFHEDNDKVTQTLNRQLTERLTAIEKRFVAEADGQVMPARPDDARWLEGKCAPLYHSPSFVSVGCDTMEGPGAHPNVDQFAYNFQICPDVRELALADLCRSLPECRKRIIDLINEDFRTGEKKQTGIQFRPGTAPAHGEPSDPEHPVATLRVFGITPAGLRFYLFDELPHVLQGFAVVDVPADKLRAVLRSDMATRIWPSAAPK